MMKKKWIIVISFLAASVQNYKIEASSFVNQYATIQSQYIQALSDLLAVKLENKMSVSIADKGPLSVACIKILYPYILDIQNYANIILSQYCRQISYTTDLATLQTKFDQYTDLKQGPIAQMFASLSKNQDLQNQLSSAALQYFYNQLADSLVKNCAQLLQGLAAQSVLDDEQAQNAYIAYSLVWAAQTSTMQVPGFSDMVTFQSDVTQWIIQVIQLALQNISFALQSNPANQDLYTKTMQYYTNLAQVYTNIGNTTSANIAKQNAKNVATQLQHLQQAIADVQTAQTAAAAGRTKIIIDYANPTATQTAVTQSMQSLQTALQSYQSAQALYQGIYDTADAASCQAMINALQIDIDVRTIEQIWLNFLQNTTVTVSDTNSNSPYVELATLLTLDPTQQSFAVSDSQAAVADLYNLITQESNAFYTNQSVQSLLQNAMALSQANALGGANVAANSNAGKAFIDQVTLFAFENMLSNFTALVKSMYVIGTGSIGNILPIALTQAKQVDSLYSQNTAAQSLLFYFPSLLGTSSGVTLSFAAFLIQYTYRIWMNYMATYTTLAQEGTTNAAMVTLLVDGLALLANQDYLTSAQIADVQNAMTTLAQAMSDSTGDQGIEAYAQSVYAQAQASVASDWINTATATELLYTSTADALWQQAIQLCEVGMYLSNLPGATALAGISFAQLQTLYVAILEAYVQAFTTNVTTLDLASSLHMLLPLCKWYNMSIALKDTKGSASALVYLQQICGGSTGLFALIQTLVNDLSSIISTKTLAGLTPQDEAPLKTFMARMGAFVVKQTIVQWIFGQLLGSSFAFDDVGTYTQGDQTVSMSVQLGTYHDSISFTSPIYEEIESITAQINNYQAQATKAEAAQNFSQASQLYSDIKQSCITQYSLLTSQKDIDTCRTTFNTANTLYAATYFAALVSSQGALTMGTLQNIAKQYFVAQYRLPITMTEFGAAGTVPATLQSAGANLSATVTTIDLTSAALLPALNDAKSLVIAYLNDQILQENGLNFTTCYTDYTMQQLQTGLTAAQSSLARQVAMAVKNYLNQSPDLGISLDFVSADQVGLLVENLAIPALTPIYNNGPSAAMYYLTAQQLFQPRNVAAIIVGGSSYTPGQDEPSYTQMFSNIGYTYLAQAQAALTLAQSSGQDLAQKVATLDEADFLSVYTQVSNNFLNAQALLYSSNNSAFAYFSQGKQTALAAAVKEIFLDSYQTQTKIVSGFLIGDPTSNNYKKVLSDLNQTYIAWSVELDPIQDAAQITNNGLAIGNLYEQAGTSCMNYAYQDPMFPGISMYHFMDAASYFLAAKGQYESMQNQSAQVATAQTNAYKAYFHYCMHKIHVYNNAQVKGLVYTSATTSVVTPITIAQLLSDYGDGNSLNMDVNELTAYNILKDLLLDAARYFDYFDGVYQQLAGSAASAPGTINSALITFLQNNPPANSVLASGVSTIDYSAPSTLANLFTVANGAFDTFNQAGNMAALADLCAILFTAVQQQYINDYLGGSSDSFTDKVTAFISDLQAESSTSENPASIYVG